MWLNIIVLLCFFCPIYDVVFPLLKVGPKSLLDLIKDVIVEAK